MLNKAGQFAQGLRLSAGQLTLATHHEAATPKRYNGRSRLLFGLNTDLNCRHKKARSIGGLLSR